MKINNKKKIINSITLIFTSFFVVVIFLGIFFSGYFFTKNDSKINKKTYTDNNIIKTEDLKEAYFSGGCFWCIEAPFQETKGVFESISGYIGGISKNANYEAVLSGKTKHRESVQVFYNQKEVLYEDLVKIFFRQINPVDDGGQFSDRGYQYTTAIYYKNEKEKEIAQKVIKELNDSKKFLKKIVTKIIPFSEFFTAEEYHQDYYKKSSLRYKFFKKYSGRTDFLEENFAKEIALEVIKKSKEKENWENFKKPSKEILKKELSKLQYYVTQDDGTERAYQNIYWNHKEEGIYVDVVSGEPLFSSIDKYDSKTGWPSFTKSIDGISFKQQNDYKLGYKRIEIKSKIANSHLGHIFFDGPKDKGGLRYCINSASLNFIPKNEMHQKGYQEFLILFVN